MTMAIWSGCILGRTAFKATQIKSARRVRIGEESRLEKQKINSGKVQRSRSYSSSSGRWQYVPAGTVVFRVSPEPAKMAISWAVAALTYRRQGGRGLQLAD